MPGTLYALLVGIDQYPDPKSRLHGSCNDVTAVRTYLDKRVGRRLSIETLTDAEATRERIIDRFRAHLWQAGPGETALFYFSGHGSQEFSASPYAEADPSRISQGLVAYDSRPNGLLLADKELAVLVAVAARREAHVLVILDACHSGTATRESVEEMVVRRLDPSREQRSIESYWFYREMELPSLLGAAGGWRVLPRGRHVLLAACEDYQLAREFTPQGGQPRGLFTYHLLEVLARIGHGISYRELLKQVQTLVSNANPLQVPQGEGDLPHQVLDGALVPLQRAYYLRHHFNGGWQLDAGSVHGLQKETELTVLPPGIIDLGDLSGRLAGVKVTEVGPASSRIEVIEGAIPQDLNAYPSVITRSPLSPFAVAVAGTSLQTQALRDAIAASPFLNEPTVEAARVVVRPRRESCSFRRKGTLWDLIPPLKGAKQEVRTVVAALEHMARWETVARLHNPEGSLAEKLELALFERVLQPQAPGAEQELVPIDGQEAHIRYRRNRQGEEIERPRLVAKVTNRSPLPLYFGFLALDEDFSVHIIRDCQGRLPPGDTIWLRKEDGVPLWVPDDIFNQGITQRRDLLMLVASERQADFSYLEQPPLFEPYRHRGVIASPPKRPSVLEALLWRIGSRNVDEPAATLTGGWAVLSRFLVVERPRPYVALRNGGEARRLSGHLTIHLPQGFSGWARLHNLAAAHRRCPALALPAEPEDSALRPLALGPGLGSDPGLAVLELVIENPEAVTAGRPLVLEISDLQPDQRLAAVVCVGKQNWLFLAGEGTEPFVLVLKDLGETLQDRIENSSDPVYLWIQPFVQKQT